MKMISWLLSFQTMTTSKFNLERIALSFESKRKKKTVRSHKANDSNEMEFQLVLFLPWTTLKCPRKSLVTARYIFMPGKYRES